MNRMIYCILLLGCIFFSNGTQGQSLDEGLTQIVSDLDNNLYLERFQQTPITIFIHRVSYKEDGLDATSDLCTHIAEQFEQLLNQSPNFRVLTKNKVKQVVRSRDWKLEASTPSVPEHLGSMLGVYAVCVGEIEVAGDKIKISAMIRTVKSSSVISDASVLLEWNAIPGDLSAYTENHDIVDFQDMTDFVSNDEDVINLDVFVNHAPDNEYQIGDELKIFIKADHSCYVKVLYRDSNGDDLILFPRHETDNPFFSYDQTYEIPPAGQYRIIASPPLGTECLKVFASTQPFGEIEEEYLQVAYIRQRGMRIEKKAEPDPAENIQSTVAYGEKTITIRVIN